MNNDEQKQDSEAELPEENPVARGEKAIEAARVAGGDQPKEQAEEKDKKDAETWRNEG